MLVRRLVFFSVVVFMVAMFNNCDNNFTIVQLKNNGFSQSTGDVCLDALKQVYSTTYWPFLKQTCGPCHADKHGSSNLTTSFNSFMSYGTTLIDHQATTAHGGNALGPQEQPLIDAFKPAWNQANDTYMVCKAGTAGANSSVIDLPLAGKAIANLQATLTNATLYVPLSYNTGTEVASNPQMNVIPGTLTIQARFWMNGTIAMGLLFRNPVFTPGAGGKAFVLSGLSVALNGVDQSQFFTTYKTLGSLGAGIPIPAGGTTPIPLAPTFGSAPIEYDTITSTTLVGLIIKNAVFDSAVPGAGPTPTPAPGGGAVTFTQLNAAGGIFANNCAGCHNATTMAGTLDITNYTAAMALAATISARVTSAAAPMPPAGLLPADQQATITSWVNAGAPQ